MERIMKTIAQMEDRLCILRQQLSLTKDPDEKAELEERIDFIQDEIDEIENEVDPEDIYGVLGHDDTPSINRVVEY